MKKIDNIIIIIFIINLILFVFLLIWNPNKTNEEENTINIEGYPEDENEEAIEETTSIYIDNIAEFTSKYSGDYTPAEVNSVVSSYVNGELKRIYVESNKIGFIKYYNNNKDNIKNIFGITNANDFEIFMKHISLIADSDIQSASIRSASIIERDYNIEYILDIVLNTQETISIKVETRRYNNNPPMIIVSPLEEEITNEE